MGMKQDRLMTLRVEVGDGAEAALTQRKQQMLTTTDALL